MRQGFTIVIGLAALFAVSQLLAQTSRTADVQFKAAQHKEQVEGDLKGAIEQYKKLAQSKDRAIAAKALIQMAECYQKLGDAQARTIFEQVVREFADQKDAVVTARNHLGGNVTGQNGGVVARQVWTLESGCCDVFGTVSPDGRYLPYLAYENRASDLYLRDLTTGAKRQLTNLSPADRGTNGAPDMGEIGVSLTGIYSFSRDGKQLAYAWENFKSGRQEIRVISLQGSGVPAYRKLFDNEDVRTIQPHDWSPDGKWIAVALQRKDRSAQIGLVSTQDGSFRALKSVDWNGPSHIFFSPDGKHLGFDFQRDVFILAIDGSREIPAAVDPGRDVMMGWSRDGSRLLFASDRAGSTSLFAVHLTDGEAKATPDLIKRDIGESMESLGVTTSGALFSIIYPGKSSSAGTATDIQRAAFDFGTGRFLSPPEPAVQTFVGTNRQPNWSPDGKYLAYLSRDLVMEIRSLATAEVRDLSLWQHLSYVFGFTGWSSDSRSFILSATDSKGRSGIFRTDAQTGQTTLIVQTEEGQNPGSLNQPAESPDGKFLYYHRSVRAPGEVRVTSHTFIKRDLATGNENEIIRRDNLGPLVLSPDGRSIVTGYNDASTKSISILLIPTSGGEARELMHSDPPANGLMWAPDSRSVFIRNGSELWRAPLDGGIASRLDVKMPPGLAGVFRVHPDGRQIAFQVNGQNKPAEVWVLENFLPAPTAKK